MPSDTAHIFENLLDIETMASGMATTSGSQMARGRFEGQLVSNEVKQPDFWAIPEIAYKDGTTCALSMISLQVVMI